MSDAREATMKQEAEAVKAPELTLDPESRKLDFSFLEPSMKKDEITNLSDGTVASAGSVDESMLSDAEKQQVDAFVKQIDVSNVRMVNSYLLQYYGQIWYEPKDTSVSYGT